MPLAIRAGLRRFAASYPAAWGLAAACLVASGLAWVPAAAAPVVPPALGREVTAYWRCREGESLVLADRPCGPEAVREGVAAGDVNGYVPVPPPEDTPSRPRRRSGGRTADRTAVSAPSPAATGATASARATTSPATTATAGARRRLAECGRIGRSLDRLESRQRAGHSGKQGEKMRAQQDELAARRWQLRCRATELAPARPP